MLICPSRLLKISFYNHPPIYRAKERIKSPPTRPSPALRVFAAPVNVGDDALVLVLLAAAAAVVLSVEAGAEVIAAAADVVSRGPSQCQWSPCTSQPIDSAGLGSALALVLAGRSVWSVWSSWSSWSSGAAVEVTTAAVVVGAMGAATVGAVVTVTGPLQCLFVDVS